MRDQSPPACGVSTLITSAPCCASIMAQDGPATPPVRSMTFTPANAESQSMVTARFPQVNVALRVADLGGDDNVAQTTRLAAALPDRVRPSEGASMPSR